MIRTSLPSHAPHSAIRRTSGGPHVEGFVCTDKQYRKLTEKVRSSLSDDLRKPPWKGNANPMAGHCYVASEALYHMLGGHDAGWTPVHISHEGGPHWFLRNQDGTILDPTADQFRTPVPYDKGRGGGFLTRDPSHRAQVVIDRVEG